MSDTVCIAAVCVPDKSGRVFAVLCSDARIEIPDLASGTIGFKAVEVARGITIMYAGVVPKAREMIERYKYHLSNADLEMTHENVLDVLGVPLRAQQRRDVVNYISATYGMRYEEYLAKEAGEQQNLLFGLPSWKDYAELIVVWLGDNFVRLFSVSEKITEHSAFATIGTGGNVANASLFSRGYRAHSDLREAAYYVYEAKRNSENVPGVGKETHMEIQEFHSAGTHVMYRLTANEIDVLGKQFLKLGPQPFEILSGEAQLSFSFIPGKKP